MITAKLERRVNLYVNIFPSARFHYYRYLNRKRASKLMLSGSTLQRHGVDTSSKAQRVIMANSFGDGHPVDIIYRYMLDYAWTREIVLPHERFPIVG